jgi:hypothetical protein
MTATGRRRSDYLVSLAETRSSKTARREFVTIGNGGRSQSSFDWRTSSSNSTCVFRGFASGRCVDVIERARFVSSSPAGIDRRVAILRRRAAASRLHRNWRKEEAMAAVRSQLEISRTDPADPVRNLRLVTISTTSTPPATTGSSSSPSPPRAGGDRSALWSALRSRGGAAPGSRPCRSTCAAARRARRTGRGSCRVAAPSRSSA